MTLDSQAETLSAKELSFKFLSETIANPRHPERNEDAVGFDQQSQWGAVLDGAGGHIAGDQASRVALEVIGRQLAKIGKKTEPEKAKQQVKEAIEEASKAVAEKVPGGRTTAVVAKIVGSGSRKTAVIGSVGDSRVYLLRKGELVKITQDDRPIPPEVIDKLDEVESRDQLDVRERAYFNQRNQLTASLGGDGLPAVHLYQIALEPEGRLILASDGVTDNLTTDEIKGAALGGGSVAKEIVESAKKRPTSDHLRAKKDDISAVVIGVNET